MKCNRLNELRIGRKIEMEHHLGKTMAKKIAMDHIKEFPCYYSQGLIPLENKLRQMGRRR